NGMYSRTTKPNHIYKYFDSKTNQIIEGWTIDKDACDTRIFNECTFLTIQETESQIMYMVSTKDFMTNCIKLRDRYFLPLTEWEQKESKTPFKRVQIIEK